MYNIKNFEGFNWIGFYTLYTKEVKRFLNVFAQTIMAPAVTTLLFYLIFSLSIDRDYLNSSDHSFSEFLAPGLICMAIMQNSFANTSSSILISKVQGNIVDVLMPPMAEYELTFSYMLGGITRGLLVGFFVGFFIFFVVFGSGNLSYSGGKINGSLFFTKNSSVFVTFSFLKTFAASEAPPQE